MGRAARRKREKRAEAGERRERSGGALAGVPAQPGKCVYTCGRDATTNDHVPPAGLFVGVPGPPKVPSCLHCNGGSSGDDEYFRLTVVANEKAGHHPAARAVWEKTFRGLQRPEAAGFKHGFYGSLGHLDLLDQASGTVRRVLAYPATGKRQGRVVARVARGLYYRDTGRVLPDHHVMAWPVDFLLQKEIDPRRPLTDIARRMWNTVKDRRPIEMGSRVLTYWCESFGSKYVVWFFLFYYGMPFFAMAIPKETRPLPAYLADFEFPPSVATTADPTIPTGQSAAG